MPKFSSEVYELPKPGTTLFVRFGRSIGLYHNVTENVFKITQASFGKQESVVINTAEAQRLYAYLKTNFEPESV